MPGVMYATIMIADGPLQTITDLKNPLMHPAKEFPMYDKPSGHRAPRLPLTGRKPIPAGIAPSPEQRSAIARIAEMHPRWSPQECYSSLRLDGHNIPREVVEVVLAELEHDAR